MVELLWIHLLIWGQWRSRGRRWCSWLRHCATNWKVTGSIPNDVIGIFHWQNPSSRTMALGSTQPLTEIGTENISWGWRRPVCRADNLSPSCANCFEMWELQTAETLMACPGLFRDLFTFTMGVCHLKIILIKVISWCLLFYHNSNHQLSQQ